MKVGKYKKKRNYNQLIEKSKKAGLKKGSFPINTKALPELNYINNITKESETSNYKNGILLFTVNHIIYSPKKL